MSKLLKILVLCAITLSLTSCGLYDLLGIDTHDYAKEEAIAALENDCDIANEISDMILIMVENSPHLREFDNPSDAAELYRNGLLCYILERNYAKYSANIDLIEKTRELYPTYELTTVIPAVDFEGMVYRYFGGTASVGNRSTDLFTYLDKVDAYVSVGIGVDNGANIEISELYETENTYVCKFSTEMAGIASGPYTLLLMKREDGTFYMKSLKK